MQASLDNQQRILRIAELDLLLANLDQRIKNLPEAKIFRDLTVEFETTRNLRIAAETELSDLSGEINRAESDVEQVVKRIEKDEARLNSGQGSAKELEQMQHELISLNTRRSELEEIELEVMLRADGIKERINELKAKEASLAEQLIESEKRKDEAAASIDSEIQGASANRSELVSQGDQGLLDLYEKIRSNGVVGAAKLSNGKCGGCNLAINAGDLSKLMAMADEEIARCEECRCILVRK